MTSTMNSQRGFTLMELMLTLAVFLIISTMSLALMGSAMPGIRANGQASRLIGLLQTAREMAIARQRDVELRFDVDQSTVQLVRHDNGVEVPVSMLIFEYNVKFTQFTGLGDTPEGYGSGAAIDFGGANPLLFTSDGSLVDGTGVPVSGTFYLGIESKPDSARAITVTGSTARARFYRFGAESGTWEGGWIGK